MNAFADAMAALSADPNLGEAAIYQRVSSGDSIALRVVRSAPDETIDAFGTALVRPTDIVLVATADIAAPAKGDVIIVASGSLTVLAALRDPVGVAHRLLCAR